MWRSMASAHPEPTAFGSPLLRYHLYIRSPSLPLGQYLSGINSKDSVWLTALRVSPKEVGVVDLVSLANVSNLAVLDLSDGQVSIDIKESAFNERVFRTWSDLGQAGQFGRLCALLLGWQEHLGPWILRYLPCFPSLKHVIITDCPNMHQKNRKDWEDEALAFGWKARHAKKSAKSLRPILKEAAFPLGSVSGLYHLATQSSTYRPILECWIGTPKKWTHILDDFPGTRTIFLDRIKKFAPVVQHYSDSGLKRSRQNGTASGSASNSPEPKRTMKPTLRARSAAAKSVDALMNQYTNT